jgi:hypothetical protein
VHADLARGLRLRELEVHAPLAHMVSDRDEAGRIPSRQRLLTSQGDMAKS